MKWPIHDEDGFSFWLNSGEEGHDPHLHVGRGGKEARMYLRAFELVMKKGKFNGKQKRKIKRIYDNKLRHFVGKWDAKYPNDPV